MVKTLINATPFDAKLKSLQILRRILEKDLKLVYTAPSKVAEELMRKNVLETLLNPHNFNP